MTADVARRLAAHGIDADQSLAGFLGEILGAEPTDYRVASMIVDGLHQRWVEVETLPRVVRW